MADQFIAHADRVKEVSALQRRNYRHKWNLLKPHFDGVKVTDIDATWLDHLRVARSNKETQNGTVKPQKLKKDFDFIRLVLRYAVEREKVLDSLPQFPSFRGEK